MLIRDDRVFFGIELPLAGFTELFSAHMTALPRTPEIEDMGQRLIDADFPEPAVRNFVKDVCGWGNYAGISGRVLKRNGTGAISAALKNAVGDLAQDPPRLAAALARVNSLSGLGEPSFASKHLRFLRPELCPVFDSQLREALPYSFDQEGYALFAVDCRELAVALKQAGVRNPRNRQDGVWFVADVEAALYAHVTDLANEG